jgi:iron complex transport system substrate-binding protein
MAAHTKSLALLAILFIAAPALRRPPSTPPEQRGSSAGPGRPAAAPQRIVSLIPSITEMLFAMGAGNRVVGVSNFDRYPPETATKVKVGGLIDPDIERILSLKPDLVVVYGTQTDLRAQMDRAQIAMFLYEHSDLADVTQTIRALGRRIGSDASAAMLASQIDADIADVRRRVAGKPQPRTLLVFGRDAETLGGIYASGGVGFLHDMLEAAGGANVLADVQRQSVQATTETILTRAPDVIIEVESTTTPNPKAWNVLGTVPAVRNHRVYLLLGDEMVNPGPRVARAIRRMALALHPEAFEQR